MNRNQGCAGFRYLLAPWGDFARAIYALSSSRPSHTQTDFVGPASDQRSLAASALVDERPVDLLCYVESHSRFVAWTRRGTIVWRKPKIPDPLRDINRVTATLAPAQQATVH